MPIRPRGVVGNGDAHLAEKRPEVRLVAGHRAGDLYARADVGDPRVEAAPGELRLGAPHAGPLKRAPGRGGGALRGVLQVREPHLAGEPLRGALQRPGVRVLQPSEAAHVGVVDHDVCVRDAPGVVVVVDDRHLEVGEVLAHPRHREAPQVGELDAVAGVRREDVVLVGACGLAVPGLVIAGLLAGRVHVAGPVVRRVVGKVLIGLERGRRQVQVVEGERAAVLGQVAELAAAARVPAYGLDDVHVVTSSR